MPRPDYRRKQSILLADQKVILQESLANLEERIGGSAGHLRQTFDDVILPAEHIAYERYLATEASYGGRILTAFLHQILGDDLSADAIIERTFRDHFHLLDKFFLSLAQGRKSRAGSSFKFFHNALFRMLGYPESLDRSCKTETLISIVAAKVFLLLIVLWKSPAAAS